MFYSFFFFFQAEDGIRDLYVTGVQTCALPIFSFPVFLKAFAKEFHASRSAISLAFSLHNIVAAAASPLFGRLVDRVGSRKMIILGTIALASLLIGNRFVTAKIGRAHV